MKLNVNCSKCNIGKLFLPEEYDGLADYYTIHCTECENVFETHYTGMDSLLEQHDYNNEVSEDVTILNDNGYWKQSERKKKGEFSLDDYTKGMKHLQTIETYEINHYYQKNGEFIMIVENTIHEEFRICRYEAMENKLPELMKHFFN